MKRLYILSAACLIALSMPAQEQRTQVELATDMGTIRVELFNETPLHRDNFLRQVANGTFDGVLWHRVINNFLIQTGDRQSKHAKKGELLGEGDETEADWIPAEIRTPLLFHQRGMLNAAREGDDVNPEKKSSSTQFTIITGRTFSDEELDRMQKRVDEMTGGTCTFTEQMRETYKTKGGAPHLDGSYTVFGRVVEGMDIVDRIQQTPTDPNDRPVQNLRIRKASIVAPHWQTMGMKNAFDGYFKVGVAVNYRNVTTPTQKELIAHEFNSITAENDMKPASTHPTPDTFNWRRADSIADFCRTHGIKMRGHCLVWHNQIGRWMYSDSEGRLLSKEELFAAMRNHIHAVVERYKDVVYCWDVVNEAIADNPKPDEPIYRQSPLYKIAGDEFIRKAFEYAREADPDALLFYNDYDECNPGKLERICQMIRQLKADGVPIDGFGMQGHYNIYSPSHNELDTAITRYAALVDHIHVTELDVRVNTQHGGGLQFRQGDSTITEEQKHMQASQYKMLFETFRRHSKDIDCVTFWNLCDRDSWLGAANYPLLFDKDCTPKEAYFDICP